MTSVTRLAAVAAVAAMAWAAGGGGARADITIATVGPMTGQYAAFGEQMRRGARMAVDDINAKGGVLGQKLVLEIGDDACDPKQAVAVAGRIAARDAKLVAGHFCSGSSIPASDVYRDENVLQISPGSTNPLLTERGIATLFRVCGRDDQQGRVAAEFLAKRFHGKKIAVVHDKTAYGKGLADETVKVLKVAGVEPAMYEAITAGEKDYSSLVTKLKAAGVDALYFGGYHTEAGLIVRQMRAQGLAAPLVAGDALVTQEYWTITGKDGAGTLMTFSPDPARDPRNQDIVARFMAENYKPEGYTLYTYGAIQAWVQAVTKAKSTDAEVIARTLRGGNFDTVLGTVGFDSKGDVTAPGYVVYEWQDGKYDYVTN